MLRPIGYIPDLPALSQEATDRACDKERAARERLRHDVESYLRRGDQGAPNAPSYLELLPFFEQYAWDVFQAYAAEYQDDFPDDEARRRVFTRKLIPKVVESITPDKVCTPTKALGDVGGCFPWTFDEWRSGQATAFRIEESLNPETDEVEEREVPCDPSEVIGHSGVWEDTLSRWAGVQGLKCSPEAFYWTLLRALRNWSAYNDFKDKIESYLRTDTLNTEAPLVTASHVSPHAEDPPSHEVNQAAESEARQNEGATISTAEARRRRVNEAIKEACDKGVKLNRKRIWQAAEYKDASQFQRWQRADTRQTERAKYEIERVLREKPWLKQ